jgi:IclR family pca regulon transcriptional regulator
MTSVPIDPRDRILGLEKGLAILEAFDQGAPRLTASLAAQRTGMTRSAARRVLLTLRSLGYVETDGRMFWLAPPVLRLGAAYYESGRLPRLTQPFLQRLTASVHEAAYVSVRDGDALVYVARNGANPGLLTGFMVGSRLPLAVTSAGMVLLAALPDAEIEEVLTNYPFRSFTPHSIANAERLRVEIQRARAQGYALLEQQLQIGVRGVAVLLRDHRDAVVGALSLSTPIGAVSSADAAARALPALRETARALRKLL